ncbi:acetylglutamate kinase [Methanonatronarchaeum sp. AMET6-2]|uniref:acetylglutamate kinase n=1 Tax=Methanonatronarchaeum sp. AMET6-2 TaxID=2933293 RepID=UPI0011F57972|nr:acetylglutamate kinase [Methanonatronarchaeum sp. AMET6-2]RZN63214.1 MAG: acetylglutamate kinase [Methanonatronarchaeia archaeon]UOY10527.1 acetylglutamate kinase [Methanonatronarchaeum sp. AMET6-2]
MKRENILVEALPYIRNLHGSKIVIKCGGHAIVNNETMENIIKDIVLLRYIGVETILVHGGGPEISRVMNELGIKPKVVDGLRVTDEKTMEVVRMVLIGNVGTELVSKIGSYGGKGIGLSGKDGRLFTARKKGKKKVVVENVEKEIDLGYVGEIESVDPEMIDVVSSRGYIPVISPIAVDDEGRSLNVNADTVAGEIATSVGAKKLMMMTNVDGVMRDQDDKTTVLSQMTPEYAEDLLEEGVVEGGMIPKINSCVNAVRQGVEKAHIINGERPHSLLLELFTDEGVGTMIHE